MPFKPREQRIKLNCEIKFKHIQASQVRPIKMRFNGFLRSGIAVQQVNEHRNRLAISVQRAIVFDP